MSRKLMHNPRSHNPRIYGKTNRRTLNTRKNFMKFLRKRFR